MAASTSARWKMSESLAAFATSRPEFLQAVGDRAVAIMREVRRHQDGCIEVAADALQLAGWTYQQMRVVTFAHDPGLVELAVEVRPGVTLPVLEVRTGTPTAANGWTIAVEEKWLRRVSELPVPPSPKFEGVIHTHAGDVPIYSDDSLAPNEMRMVPWSGARVICPACHGLSSKPDCMCDGGMIAESFVCVDREAQESDLALVPAPEPLIIDRARAAFAQVREREEATRDRVIAAAMAVGAPCPECDGRGWYPAMADSGYGTEWEAEAYCACPAGDRRRISDGAAPIS